MGHWQFEWQSQPRRRDAASRGYRGRSPAAGLTLRLGGDSEQLIDVFTSFGVTLALSVVCILLVLLVLFHNWIDPLVIALSLPLAVVARCLRCCWSGANSG